MGETILERIKRVALEEIGGYLILIAFMFLVIVLVFIFLPIAEILEEPVLMVLGGIAISGWIAAMVISQYPFLILGLLVALLIAVLLIRNQKKK